MSETRIEDFTAGVRLSATVQEERCPPQFLAETGVLAEVCRGRGLLDKIEKQLHVPRGRAGIYEACDFTLPLLAHAVSNNRYLKNTYEEMHGQEAVLAALWGRQNVPSRSALSRWAAQVPPAAVEELGMILFADLLEHGVGGNALGGVYDRLGQRRLVFDIDGTRQAGRQRALVQGPEHPPPRRRLGQSCAPGYRGRKRGEVVRNRSIVQQAHSHEWLGLFAAPGNGELLTELSKCSERIGAYMRHHQLEPTQAIVRVDGAYGRSASAQMLGEAGMDFVLRCTDYGLLDLQRC